MTICTRIQEETKIPLGRVQAVANLLDDGNTIPFIARYRKEMTGGLDENDLRLIEERLKFHRQLEQRKEEILRLIEGQGKLSVELERQIREAVKPVELEDIYLPFRPKRKTRASAARDQGLQPLAEWLLAFPADPAPEVMAAGFCSEELPTAEQALQGAMDIVAEQVAEDPAGRGWIRNFSRQQGMLVVTAIDDAVESPYRMYYHYQEQVAKIPPHRILAVNRGEREKILKVAVVVAAEPIIEYLNRRWVRPGSTAGCVQRAVLDGYARLIKPAIERDLRHELTERAEAQATQVFTRNLNSLLMQPPVKGRIILGLDPAYRTGCKWAVIDDTGKMLAVGVVYPTPPQKQVAAAEAILVAAVEKYGVNAIAIGNGTASRETEQFVAAMIKHRNLGIPYTIVSEAGASVYSASKLAGEEFPDLDAAQRSAISIARRVQDPLAELVKIEPRAIGVGQYQHDLPPKELDRHLTEVVESAVNRVGVELNTASAALLGYVSGLSPAVARNVVHYRENNGKFSSRRQLLKVAKLGAKAFQQAAGFLRIAEASNPLDGTAIHPESYELAQRILDLVQARPEEVGTPGLAGKLAGLNIPLLAEQLSAGEPTVRDVIASLLKPHRDPREELPPPLFRTDVLSIEDLQPGMSLVGTVRNVVDFGAFVDIGVKQDGLVHLSELAERYIRHPLEAVAIGDVVTVRVLAVDRERGKIALSMRSADNQQIPD